MQFEFTQVLADQGHQPGVVGSWREFRKDHLISAEEELHAEQANPSQVLGHGPGHGLGLLQLLGCQLCRLPAALVITVFLFMADRCAEQGLAVVLADGQQRDFEVEPEKFLHNHAGGGSPGTGHRCVPGLVQTIRSIHNALPFAG